MRLDRANDIVRDSLGLGKAALTPQLQAAPPSAGDSDGRPTTADSHATAADELRILGRRLGPILIISDSAVCHSTGQEPETAFSAVAADAPDS